jgi:hypothetical protein
MIDAFGKLSDEMKVRAVNQMRTMLATSPKNQYLVEQLKQMQPHLPPSLENVNIFEPLSQED